MKEKLFSFAVRVAAAVKRLPAHIGLAAKRLPARLAGFARSAPGRAHAFYKKNRAAALSLCSLLLAAVVLGTSVSVLVGRSGAWLRDEGRWGRYDYTVGVVDISFFLNDENLALSEGEAIELTGAVPITGGVKINDSAEAAPTAPNYEPYAEENFNEGVTVAHVGIINNSSFPASLAIDYELAGFFDTPGGADIFYLILPAGSTVDYAARTVTLPGGSPVTFKNYVKSCMPSYATVAEMKTSLDSYYSSQITDNVSRLRHVDAQLRKNTGTNDAPTEGSRLDLYLLFWAEYSSLPFVETDTNHNDVALETQNGAVEHLSGTMTVNIQIDQSASPVAP